MSKPRPMPFWAEDWLTSMAVQTMSLEEQGGYFRLLCYCWTARGHALPDDDAKLLLLSCLNRETWDRGNVRAMFTTHPTIPSAVSNPKLLEVSAEDLEYRSNKAKAGKISARARRQQKANRASTERQPPSPSPSPTPKEEEARARDPQSTTPERVVTGGTSCTRENAVALLRHYQQEYRKAKGKAPVMEFGGAYLNAAYTALQARGLAECKGLVGKFLELDGREAAEGWPFTFFPRAIAKLENPAPATGKASAPSRPKTPDELAAADPEHAARLAEFRARSRS